MIWRYVYYESSLPCTFFFCVALSHVTAFVFVLLAYCFDNIARGKLSHVFLTLIHRLLITGYYEEVLAATRHKHTTCWIVTQSIEDKRARTLAATHNCELITNPSQYTDYTLLQAAPKTLVMGMSTFIYFPAFLGAATEVVKRRRGDITGDAHRFLFYSIQLIFGASFCLSFAVSIRVISIRVDFSFLCRTISTLHVHCSETSYLRLCVFPFISCC